MTDWVVPVLEPQVVMLCLLLTVVLVAVVALAVLGLGVVLGLVLLARRSWTALLSGRVVAHRRPR